jgi:hypothetical protein
VHLPVLHKLIYLQFFSTQEIKTRQTLKKDIYIFLELNFSHYLSQLLIYKADIYIDKSHGYYNCCFVFSPSLGQRGKTLQLKTNHYLNIVQNINSFTHYRKYFKIIFA